MNSLYGKFASKVSRYNALQLSMAISSYARAEMSLYKLKYFIYTDTDSIIYTEKLSDKFLGRDIGLMKLVSRIDFGYFLPNYYTYTRGRYRVMKAKVMIKRVLPTLKDLVFTFKLLYFKRRKYSIYLQETIFKYNYPTKNVKQFPAKKPIAGLD